MSQVTPVPAYILGMSPNGLSMVQCLGHHGIPCVALDAVASNPSLRSRYCRPVVMPPLKEQPGAWLDFLMKEPARKGISGVLLPAGDEAALFVSRNRQRLGERYRFVQPDAELMEAFPNKKLWHELAESAGMPLPQTLFPKSVEEIRANADKLRYPVAIKPVYSHFWSQHPGNPYRAEKLCAAENLEEAIRYWEEMDRIGLEVMLTELIPGGPESLYGVVTYIDRKGTVQGSIVVHKLRQTPADYGVASVMISVEEPEARELAINFLKKINYRGIGHIEMKRDERDGKFCLIETNARHILFGSLLVAAGYELPLIAYKDALEQELNVSDKYRAGVRWIQFEGDYGTYRVYKKRGWITRWQWIRSLLPGRKAFAYFDWRDPMPFWVAFRRFVWRWRHGRLD
ncbi:MAG: hypothetical protein JW937_09680 [Candidatus Omnitrophica bacterium]|nr:hypothetical protein [Candidatus Omnitrophota bacterium]